MLLQQQQVQLSRLLHWRLHLQQQQQRPTQSSRLLLDEAA
jgi:hypothetical protein